MLPLLLPLLEGVASYAGFEIANKLFGNTKTKTLPIPIKSKKRLPKIKKTKSKLNSTNGLNIVDNLYNLSRKSEIGENTLNTTRKILVNADRVLSKPSSENTLIGVLKRNSEIQSAYNSAATNALTQMAISSSTFLPQITDALITLSKRFEKFEEHLDFHSTPQKIIDFDGNELIQITPRDLELLQKFHRAKLDKDENDLEIGDITDDYENTFSVLEKIEELFKFQGISQNLKDIVNGT